jgi:hypothetical protein
LGAYTAIHGARSDHVRSGGKGGDTNEQVRSGDGGGATSGLKGEW